MSTPEFPDNSPTPEREPSGKTWGFYELQTRVVDIYEAHDRECGYGPDTMIVKLLGNAEVLKRIARRKPDDIQALDQALTNVLIWTATFANAARTPIQSILLEKYGNGCQRCRQIPCVMTHGQECVDSPNFLGTKPEKTPESLGEWQAHLAAIYPNNFLQGADEALKMTTERVLDEIVELASSTHQDIERELSPLSRHRNHEDKAFPWKGEIADVLAWSFGVAEVLRRRTNGEYSVETSLKEKYSESCPYCKHPQCGCPKEVTVIDDLSKGLN